MTQQVVGNGSLVSFWGFTVSEYACEEIYMKLPCQLWNFQGYFTLEKDSRLHLSGIVHSGIL